MKKIILSISLLLLSFISSAQKGIDSIYVKPFKREVRNYYSIAGIWPLIIYLNADTNTKKMGSVRAYPDKPRTNFVYLEGANVIRLQSNLNKDSLKYFRYTVVEDDSIILAKDLIPKWFEGINRPYNIDFGTFNIKNRKISLTLYEVGRKKYAKEVILYNKEIKPVEVIEAGLVKLYTNPPVVEIQKNSKGDVILEEKAVSQTVNINIKGRSIPFDDSRTYAEIKIKPIENVFLYQILIKRKNSQDFENFQIDDINWAYNDSGNISARLDIKYFSKPGKYEIVIFPKTGVTDGNKLGRAVGLSFEIAKPSLTKKQILGYLSLLFLIIILIFIVTLSSIKRKNRKIMLLAQQQTDRAKLQLASVRSQLNPHFLFNALAGIQMLMNKNETDNANRYLNKFARLTRNVLENKELISLTAEKTLMDDYLQMEQLRFGFQYKISASADLDTENIEIPAMLLQPFVENAVKHGVAEKGNAGQIEINFIKQGTDLVLRMADNGSGFDTFKNYDGLGLALSKNRVSLLNSIYKETPFVLDIQSGHSGTTVNITLTQWL